MRGWTHIRSTWSMLASMLVRVEWLMRWDVLWHSKTSVMSSECVNERLMGQTKLRRYSTKPQALNMLNGWARQQTKPHILSRSCVDRWPFILCIRHSFIVESAGPGYLAFYNKRAAALNHIVVASIIAVKEKVGNSLASNCACQHGVTVFQHQDLTSIRQWKCEWKCVYI